MAVAFGGRLVAARIGRYAQRNSTAAKEVVRLSRERGAEVRRVWYSCLI